MSPLEGHFLAITRSLGTEKASPQCLVPYVQVQSPNTLCVLLYWTCYARETDVATGVNNPFVQLLLKNQTAERVFGPTLQCIIYLCKRLVFVSGLVFVSFKVLKQARCRCWHSQGVERHRTLLNSSQRDDSALYSSKTYTSSYSSSYSQSMKQLATSRIVRYIEVKLTQPQAHRSTSKKQIAQYWSKTNAIIVSHRSISRI